MFLPIFIAILLGLASPSEISDNSSLSNGTTISISESGGANSGNGSDDPNGDTGGENTPLPPPKVI